MRAVGSAGGPTTARCDWHGRSPTSPARRGSAKRRWRRRCSCEGGTGSEVRACVSCLRRSWLLSLLGPYLEKTATGKVGRRSPELLRLSNEDLAEVVAPE